MAHEFYDEIPPDAAGLMLCKIVGSDDLRISDAVVFTNGRAAVLTTLNRASLHGHVGGGIDEATDFWADILNSDGDGIGEIRLNRESWNSLKNKWMPCKMQQST